MQFLDAIGLAYFWEKIKNWANSCFFSKEGGEISPKSGLQYTINGEHLGITTSGGENETINIFDVDENGMEAIAIVKTGGTATQVLMADGSVKTLNANNGIAGLDSNGYVPLAQLGNLDTTVAEVVTVLPTTNIKKHIYLIKDTSGVTQNQYEEYIYTGDTSATYDASKWEKLGDFRATVDLKDYSKKNETISIITWENRGSDLALSITTGNGIKTSEFIPVADSSKTGVMSNTDKVKLDGIEARANNYSLPLATNAMRGGIQVGYAANGKNYPVQLSGEKAYVNVPWTDTNTTYGLATSTNDGLMKASDKAKIDRFDISGISGSDRIDIGNLITAEFNDVEITSSNNSILVSLATVNGSSRLNFSLPAATSEKAGLMVAADKTKLNGIASGATADSAITTTEIDALFA